jgi:acyl carrier protein
MTAESQKDNLPKTCEEVEQFIRHLTVDTLMLEGVDPASIDPNEQDFLIALGANSIDALELMISVEERLGFEFGDDELNAELVSTLNHFVSVVCNKLEITA